MKTIITLICVATLLTGCNSNELNREEALQMIKKEKQYPKVIDYDIYCGDPHFARKLIDAGLEREGLITVQRVQKLSDAGEPIIQFTDKARPYLLTTPAEDKANNIQKVKVADEDLFEIKEIKNDMDGKRATAEYTTSYKSKTPFSVLLKVNFDEVHTRKASFSQHHEGWKLEK